jgi:hypothetical protein
MKRAFARTAVLTAMLAACTAASVAVPAAYGADPPFFWERCPSESQADFLESPAGPCSVPRGVAADPASGNVFVVDQTNNRIQEFTPWGGFVRAFGWDVAPEGAPGDTPANQLETCTATCQGGVGGHGAGQLASGRGVDIDSAGGLYLVDVPDRRVQKFDVSGPTVQFEWMIGKGVEQGPLNPGDICTATDIAAGDDCGGGGDGTGPGQFFWVNVSGWAEGEIRGDTVAVDRKGTASAADDRVYVGDQKRIQVFDVDGEYLDELSLTESSNPGTLAVDQASGDLYFAYASRLATDPNGVYRAELPEVLRLDPDDGTVLDTLPTDIPQSVAVGAAGQVYVFDDEVAFGSSTASHPSRILEFDSLGNQTAVLLANVFANVPGLTTSSACGIEGDALYLSHVFAFATYDLPYFIRAYGNPPDPAVCPPPPVPPTIDESYAVSVGTETAALRAKINPRFWPDTTYRMEYGPAACSSNPCASIPPAPGKELTDKVTDTPVAGDVELAGLEPSTTYHYRFIATSSGGGPTVGPDRTFHTFAEPQENAGCSNQALRTGPSQHLPDCRAYELVSPPEKDGDVWQGANFDPAIADELIQASPDGERITYSTYRAFGDAESADFAPQYLATREGSAWGNHALNPARSGTSFFTLFRVAIHTQAFSEDLCSAYFIQETDNQVGPEDQPGYTDLLRRDNCGEEDFQTVTSKAPLNLPADKQDVYWPRVQGFSADGSKTVFRANAKLTNNASNADVYQLYMNGPGIFRLVSVLPDGSAASLNSNVGTQNGNATNYRRDAGIHAVSEDGSRVYWMATGPGPVAGNSTPGQGPGSLYLRLNVDKAPSPISEGECTDSAKACTIAVSGAVGSDPATYWGATPSGSKALFTIGNEGLGDLYSFDADSQTPTQIATGVEGLVGFSEDLSSVYLVSTDALAVGANAGDPNLYLWRQGEGLRFISDMGGIKSLTSTSPNTISWSIDQGARTSRVSQDGDTAVFLSDAPLTGFENADIVSGKADREVFLYDASEDELRCVSCNPSGARPTGKLAATGRFSFNAWTAAQIPGGPYALHSSRLLAEDGSRLFFESFESLDPRDVNGKLDVYQWRKAGTGECEATDPSYSPGAAGCLSLISTGTHDRDSTFLDASTGGEDVFIRTSQDLVPVDNEYIDIYDARVNGGLSSQHPVFPPSCEGEACRGQGTTPPPVTPPGTPAFKGPGNPQPQQQKAKKKKAKKHKKKSKQRKSKQKKQSKRARGSNR